MTKILKYKDKVIKSVEANILISGIFEKVNNNDRRKHETISNMMEEGKSQI
jgi:hypothetical protein